VSGRVWIHGDTGEAGRHGYEKRHLSRENGVVRSRPTDQIPHASLVARVCQGAHLVHSIGRPSKLVKTPCTTPEG
jgi:hypothetical protein